MNLNSILVELNLLCAVISASVQWWLVQQRIGRHRRSRTVVYLLASVIVTTLLAVGFAAVVVGRPVSIRYFLLLVAAVLLSQAALAWYTHRYVDSLRERHEQRLALMTQRLSIAEDQAHLSNLQEQFIQNVSHEMRTPLSVLKSAIELLALGQFGLLTAAQANMLAMCIRRVDALIYLVNQTIAIMRTGTYADPDDFVPLAMDVVVTEIVEDMADFADAHDLNLELVEVEQGVCVVHPDLVHQALNNVLHNAIKFTPPAGAIGVSATVADGWYEVCISDTGIGIPDAEIGRVFDRFYQVDGSSTRRYGGTGLGLAVVRYVVEFCKGEVELESKEGAGTVVRLLFPLMK